MATRTYRGSCHCGAVRFECELDLAQGTTRCNCSICWKSRFWKAIVAADAFRLVEGADALAEYRFGRTTIAHLFCRRCGVKTFGRGHLDDLGAFYAVNVACLDDATQGELSEAPLRFEDGRHERWDEEPKDTRGL
jgi:hypothetical protein